MDTASASKWDRTSLLAGVAAPIFWFLGVFVSENGNELDYGAPPEAILERFESSYTQLLLGGCLFLFGTLLFLWFLGAWRAHAAQVEGGNMRLTGTSFATGIAFATLMASTWVPQLSASLYVMDNKSKLAPEAAQTMMFVADGAFVAAEFMLAGFLFAVALLAFRGVGLPRWLAWVTVLMVVALLIPPIGWISMIFLFPLWLLLTSILLYRGSSPAPATLTT